MEFWVDKTYRRVTKSFHNSYIHNKRAISAELLYL